MVSSMGWDGVTGEGAKPWILHQLFYITQQLKANHAFLIIILVYANCFTYEEQNQSSGRFSGSRDRSAADVLFIISKTSR